MTSIMRGMLGKWLSKRSQRRHQRSLEDCLRQLDSHTLNDIGFDALLEDANDPESGAKSVVIVALKTKTSRSS